MDYPTRCDGNDVCVSTRWEDLKAAMAAFVVDPDVLGQDVRAGIQFFGQTGGYDDNDTDCNPDVYATPAVEIAPLAESGPQIMAAIDATSPSGETPSVPALRERFSTPWTGKRRTRSDRPSCSWSPTGSPPCAT